MFGLNILFGISKYPLKFHMKYLIYTLQDIIFIQHWNLNSLAQNQIW